MSTTLWDFFYYKENGGGAIAADASPNTTDPSTIVAGLKASQAFVTKPDGNEGGAGSQRLGVVSTDGACTITVWVKTTMGSVAWIPIKTGLAVTATDFVFVDVPCNATIFLQVTANAGSAKNIYAGYM